MLICTLRILNQLFRGFLFPPKLVKSGHGTITYDVPFRCWPPDLSHEFNHLNNASFFRVAEMARWRLFPSMSEGLDMRKRGVAYLVAQQTCRYHKEILPFKKYIVRTKLSTLENKWLVYEHVFLQDPATVAPGKEPIRHATIITRSVMKERGGKTVRLNELDSDFYRSIIPPTETPVSQ